MDGTQKTDIHRPERRMIILLVGLCLWIFYIYENELAYYGIYSICSYSVHEAAAIIPYLTFTVSVVWFVITGISCFRKKNEKSEWVWLIGILAVLLFQGYYIYSHYTVSVHVVGTVEHVDEVNNEITIATETGESMTLSSVALINNLVEPDSKYLITYTYFKNSPDEKRVEMIQK